MKAAADTPYFKFYNANPKNRRTTDCVIRAICVALGQDYVATLIELVKLSVATGYAYDEVRCYAKYLESKGWVKCKQPRLPNGRKVLARDFFLIGQNIPCVCHVGGHHLSCIVDGRIHDIWDCGEGCVGNYWVPQEYAHMVNPV